MDKVKVLTKVVGYVQTNCYIVVDETTKECLIIDPGANAKQLLDEIEHRGFHPLAILLTHGHFDHAGEARELAKKYDIKIYAHDAERETLEDPNKNLSTMIQKRETYSADIYLENYQELSFGNFHIKVFHTPGHTPGGCCYYFEELGYLFSGDTLFAQSVGRTDFPGGSMSQIVRSIKEQLLRLPDETIVYPGHNEQTSIENERKNNPYL